MNRELVTSKKYANLLTPAAALTATTYTQYIDLQGFDAVDILVHHGDVTASAGEHYFTVTIQETDDTPTTASNYANTAASNYRGSFTALGNGVTAGVQAVAYVGAKRYIRVAITETGTASAIVGVVAALQLSDRDPANTKSVTTGTAS